MRSSRRLLNSRIAPVQWRNAHRYWTGAALYFRERRLGEVRIPPVRWVEISRVVAPLRVVTPCYTKVQRMVPSRRVSTPKGCRHAVVERLQLGLMDRLLP